MDHDDARLPRELPVSLIALGAVALLGVAVAAAWASGASAGEASSALLPAEPPPAATLATLPAVAAVPQRVDTLFVGGYAEGSFAQAMATLASDLSDAERELVGRHLDKIFLPVLEQAGMGEGGRLRVAYERVVRPDGSTRAIQVLAAQAAVKGEMHTVFLYESGERPGYYDDWGRSLDPVPWTGPLARLTVTSPFRRDRLHPILNRILPHTGIDYAAPAGEPVRATADGIVGFAAARGGYGNLVEVQHPNGYATRYAHLSRIAVRAGTPVRQGDVVGYVGATGLATGPHLHYEVRRKGQPVDPATVTDLDGAVRDVAYEIGWMQQKRAMGRLLARTPTVVSRRAAR